jgi:hypothetical protein
VCIGKYWKHRNRTANLLGGTDVYVLHVVSRVPQDALLHKLRPEFRTEAQTLLTSCNHFYEQHHSLDLPVIPFTMSVRSPRIHDSAQTSPTDTRP